MARVFFMYVLPVLLPTAAYILWIYYRTWRLRATGGEPPTFERGRIPYLLALGAVLTVAGLGAFALIHGEDAGTTYVPPRVENGRIVPGYHVTDPQTSGPQTSPPATADGPESQLP